MADQYTRNAKHDEVRFLDEHQLAATETLGNSVTFIDCRLHFVATDTTHIHVLVSWNGPRTWKQNRTSLKRSITIIFKENFGNRPWLVENASRKQVRDRAHFDYLVNR
jgi:hypothetical protein